MTMIFVYGTLKQGYWNNRLVAGSELVATGRTYKMFQMNDVGFPLIFEPVKGMTKMMGQVKGEVYDVSDEVLAMLDRLEGHPHKYKRTELDILTGPESSVKAEAYVWQRSPIGDSVKPVDHVLEWKREVDHV
jgi:gamma-glutamylcyclotransferase (GGCT)/AIG2-like uncharacterized protein YtfP